MNKQNLMPQATQPVQRTTTGQLPPELAELSEEALSLGVATSGEGAGVTASSGGIWCWGGNFSAYDGDDAE